MRGVRYVRSFYKCGLELGLSSGLGLDLDLDRIGGVDEFLPERETEGDGLRFRFSSPASRFRECEGGCGYSIELSKGWEWIWFGKHWGLCSYYCFGIIGCRVGRKENNTEADCSHRAYAGKVERRERAMCISSAR